MDVEDSDCCFLQEEYGELHGAEDGKRSEKFVSARVRILSVN